LSQLSQLECLENMDKSFAKALHAAEVNEATSLIGKQIVFFPDGSDQAVAGQVESVNMIDGEVLLTVGSHSVGLDKVLAISNLDSNQDIGE